ncbi:hypothetical protein cauri_1922 [Corynebacterium aurimucosum ATCC 700975]|uniref:Uncharacterized protein n=2 Tax=Corynebacterium aurimucosum TaxID=169292 RepID=C3PI61_CORA7|nr:hypothetical protein cauri_1922 [Corynebacterium aurimucosum ATCC 700975]
MAVCVIFVVVHYTMRQHLLYGEVMKKAISLTIAALLLTGCGATEENGQQDSPQAQDIPEFQTVTGAGADVSSQLPSDSAWGCDSHVVNTSNGPETLKNFELEDGEATFYFAPKSSSGFNSYSYRLEFENGIMVMEDDASGDFHSFVQVYPSTEEETTLVDLGSNYLTAYFEVPVEHSDKLGALNSASAAINGELAGECEPSK